MWENITTVGNRKEQVETRLKCPKRDREKPNATRAQSMKQRTVAVKLGGVEKGLILSEGSAGHDKEFDY